MKKPEFALKEYTTKLNDDDLHYVFDRLHYRYSGDVPEILNIFSDLPDINRWLSSAESCYDLYDMVDMSYKFVEKEYKKRFAN